MKTACIYVRVSTTGGKQDYNRQINDIQKYVDYNDINIVKEFAEEMSGRKKVRPVLTSMFDYLKTTPTDYVIVSELSRLGRTNQILNDIEALTELGICLISLKDNIKTLNEDGSKNSNADLLLNILAGVNKFEVETLQFRVKSGLTNAVKKGHYTTGKAPFGYNIVNKMLAINLEEAEAVKIIFEKYLNGDGLHKIVTYLTTMGYNPKLTEKWSTTAIAQIIRNPLYKGKRRFREEYIDAPAIISSSSWEQAQKIRKSKANQKGANSKHNYLLSGGIAVCGVCGKPYYAYQRGTNRKAIYKCKSYRTNEGCGNHAITIEKVDLWLNRLIAVYAIDDVVALINTDDLDRNILNKEQDVEKVEEAIKANLKNESDLVDMRLSNTISPEIYNVKYKTIQSERKALEAIKGDLEAELDNIKAQKEKTTNSKEVAKNIAKNGLNKATLQKIVNQITIEPSDVALSKDKRDRTVKVTITFPTSTISFLISHKSEAIAKLKGTNIKMNKFIDNVVQYKIEESIKQLKK